jgi:hypothetical protein
MPTDDEAARKARADRLHAQIESCKTQAKGKEEPTQGTEGSSAEPPAGESPRDFVHRRMRELRKKNPGS